MTEVERVAVYWVLEARLAVGAKVAVVVLGLVTVPAMAAPPRVGTRVKVDVVMVVGSIRTLKVAVRLLPMATPVAAVPGTVRLTVGAAAVVPVVNDQTLAAARATPAALFTEVDRVAVYWVLAVRLAVGAKVAVVVVGLVTVPAMAAPPAVGTRVKVDVVMVAGAMATLKVTDRPLLMATPVAAAAGTTVLTVGVTTTAGVTTGVSTAGVTTAPDGELEAVGELHPTKNTAKAKAGRNSLKERMVLPLVWIIQPFEHIINYFCQYN